jgi:hypothetical protein
MTVKSGSLLLPSIMKVTSARKSDHGEEIFLPRGKLKIEGGAKFLDESENRQPQLSGLAGDTVPRAWRVGVSAPL